MRVIEAGHRYAIFNVDAQDDDPGEQEIVFVRRRDVDARLLPSDSPSRHPGILSQELIRVLIDRTLYLAAEAPCTEDVEIVEHLRASLRLYEARAARRTIEKMPMPERTALCPICHHLLCEHRQTPGLIHEISR